MLLLSEIERSVKRTAVRLVITMTSPEPRQRHTGEEPVQATGFPVLVGHRERL